MDDDPWSEDYIPDLISDWPPDVPPLSKYPNTSIPPKQIGIPDLLCPSKENPTYDYDGLWVHNLDSNEYFHITNIPDQIKGRMIMVDRNKKGNLEISFDEKHKVFNDFPEDGLYFCKDGIYDLIIKTKKKQKGYWCNFRLITPIEVLPTLPLEQEALCIHRPSKKGRTPLLKKHQRGKQKKNTVNNLV